MDKLEAFTLREILRNSAERFRSRTAFAALDGRSWTYAEVQRLALGAAMTLTRLGVKRGERVGLLAESSPEWGIAYLGIAAAGFVVVPILPDCTPAQVETILLHSDCQVIAASAKQAPKAAAESLKGVEPVDLAALVRAPETRSGDEDYASDPVQVGWDAYPEPAEEELAAIIYTSGTTGRPKGVMLTHGNIAHNVDAIPSVSVIKPTDVFLSILPMAHAYECTVGFLGPFRFGACVHYLDKPPSASVLVPALQAVRPTMMLSVPLVIEKIVRNSVFPKLDKMKLPRSPGLKKFFKAIMCRVAGMKLAKTFGGRLRFFGIGGAALAPDVEDFLRAARFPYAIGYGMTEASPLIAGCPPGKTRPRACGHRMEGVDIRITDTDATGNGEIQVRGPNVMKGYYREPALTKDTFSEDGWLRTGDLGFLDAHGFLHIRGRLKTMILGPSGENIYPEEIEALINAEEIVEDSLVYGDEDHGITALIQLKPEVVEKILEGAAGAADALGDRMKSLEVGAAHLLESLKKGVNARLAGFSRIKRFVIQHSPFERTPSKKIKRDKYPEKKAEPSKG